MAARTFKRALITGASSGIGEAFARRLAAQGVDLVVVARSKDKLEALAIELRDAHGVDVEVMAVDLANREQLADVERRLADSTGAIDLLVNNAGFGFNGVFTETPLVDEDREIQVNITALMRLSYAAIERMKSSGGGGILNVSSTASFQPSPGSANYSATKAYVSTFSQALYEEWKDAGIAVTAVCPGLTRTEFQDRGGFDVSTPSFTWQTADEVAAIGIAAVSTGRAIVVAGIFNKSLQIASRLAPLSVSRWSAGQLAKVVR